MSFKRLRRSQVFAMVLAGAVALQGCAGGPSPHKPAAPALTPPTVRAPEEVIEMAPIPNPEPSRPARPSHSLTASRHAAVPKAAEPPTAAKAASHPSAATDHLKAARLRAQGLEQLDRGQINRAVALLQTAQQLDPTNALIQRDLERALRISKAVHARP